MKYRYFRTAFIFTIIAGCFTSAYANSFDLNPGTLRIKDDKITVTEDDIEFLIQKNKYKTISIEDLFSNNLTKPPTNGLEQHLNRQNQMANGNSSEKLVKMAMDAGIETGTRRISNLTESRRPDVIRALNENVGRYPLDVDLVLAWIQQESGGDALSNGASTGLLQMTKQYWKSIFESYGTTHNETWTWEPDIYDPYKHISCAVDSLNDTVEAYNGDYFKALQSWNLGISSANSVFSCSRFFTGTDNTYGYDYGWLKPENRTQMINVIRETNRNFGATWGDKNYITNIMSYYPKN